MSARKCILAVGLTGAPAPPSSLPLGRSPFTAEQIRQMIMEGIKKVEDAGYDVEAKQINANNVKADLEEVKQN